MSSSYSSIDWVLSHWVHFTVHSLDLVVFTCVYFEHLYSPIAVENNSENRKNIVHLLFILHICCVIVSTVGWT